MTKVNAVIRDTYFGLGDGAYLTFRICIDYNEEMTQLKKEGHIIFDLYQWDREWTERVMCIIFEILKVVGVCSWDDLKGKHIRAEQDRIFDTISGIGNVSDEDSWIDFTEWRK